MSLLDLRKQGNLLWIVERLSRKPFIVPTSTISKLISCVGVSTTLFCDCPLGSWSDQSGESRLVWISKCFPTFKCLPQKCPKMAPHFCSFPGPRFRFVCQTLSLHCCWKLVSLVTDTHTHTQGQSYLAVNTRQRVQVSICSLATQWPDKGFHFLRSPRGVHWQLCCLPTDAFAVRYVHNSLHWKTNKFGDAWQANCCDINVRPVDFSNVFLQLQAGV